MLRTAAWAAALTRVLEPGVAQAMGQSARKHVQARFSRESFGRQLGAYVRRLTAVGGAGGSLTQGSARRRKAS